MQFPSEQLLTELERCHFRWTALDPKEHQRCVRRWTGLYSNLFVSGCRKRSGAKAIAEAERAVRGAFLLVPCRDPSFTVWKEVGTAYRCHGETLPDLTEISHSVDVFIGPDDFSWTLFYGHEVDVFGGPDFTTAEWMSPPPIERIAKRDFSQ